MTRTFGIDVSHWEGDINWQFASNLVNFAVLKATDGTSFIDPKFSINKLGCQDNHLSWGAYHFFHPAEDAAAQAQLFVDTVGEGCNIYVCDVETPTLRAIYGEEKLRDHQGKVNLEKIADLGVIFGISDPADIGDQVKLFLDEVTALTGKVPVIYTSPGFWNANIGEVPWAQDYPLWVAHWTQATEPELPLGWNAWKMWQITDNVMLPGVPGAVDGDLYNGSLISGQQWFGNGFSDVALFEVRVVGQYRGCAIITDIELPTNKDHILGLAEGESIWGVYERVTNSKGNSFYRVGANIYIPTWLTKRV